MNGVERDVDGCKDQQERVAYLRARSRIYSFLSSIYIKEITRDILREIREGDTLGVLEELGVRFEDDFLCSDEGQLLEDLASEYSALFIQPGGFSPEESVRLTGLHMQEPASKVKGFYKRCGFDIPPETKVFPDHLGVELEFMSLLINKEADALEAGNEEDANRWKALQTEFLERHLGLWIMEFSETVERASFHSFYREMARLTREFMDGELDDLLGEKREEIEISREPKRVFKTKGVRQVFMVDMEDKS